MDLRRADLGLLVSLDALLAERSVTAAARRLGISQPALSAQLARLRDLFGDDLLVGNAHGMAPTPRAEAIRPRLTALLKELGALVAEGAAFDPARSTRTFRIAAGDLDHALMLPPLLEGLGRDAPGVQIAALPFVTATIAEDLTSGIVDMAVGVPFYLPDGFPSLGLQDRAFAVVWRPGHPTIREMDLETFCAVRHALISPTGGGFRGRVDRMLEAMGRRREVVASLPSFLIVLDAVRSSDLVAVVPAALAARATDLCSAPLPIPLEPYPLRIAWHPRHRSDPAHRWLRDRVHAALRDTTSRG
ncbi:MAG: LysR family transcriptional regulator [Pseudomonadota bacterium]